MPSAVSSVSHHATALRTLTEAMHKHEAEPLLPDLVDRGLGAYRGYHELLSHIALLCSQNGRSARLSIAGHSVRGEPIIALSLGNPQPTENTRTSVIVAGLHPIEWIGIETALAIIGQLREVDLGDRSLMVFPIANPDGLLKVERNLRRRRGRFIRHNARGVDLNRNFDAAWGHKNLLARIVPWVFKPGSHAASEPEVASIAYMLGSRRVDRALSLHSFGGVVLYPSAHSLWPVADANEHRRWAQSIARRADAKAYKCLPSSWFGLGMTMGGLELDWFHERHGSLSLLVECSRGGIGLRPSRLFNPFAWFNPPDPRSIATRIAEATVPFVRGDATP